MRQMILHEKWAAMGAKFAEIAGAECVESFGDAAKESLALRESAVLCDISFARKFSFPEDAGLDFLDSVLAADILKLRYGKIADTFLADGGGRVATETLVADVDDRLVVVAEEARAGACDLLAAGCDGAEDIAEKFVLLSVDGPEAWKVARDIFGGDILNLPFMSAEKYDFEGSGVYLLRAGRTGEYGYQFLAPNAAAERLADALLASLAKVGGTVCGFDAHKTARLEGNFFDVYEEGARVGCPIELGLQWMADFEKESFIGSEAIFAKRESGAAKKLVGLKSAESLSAGDAIFDGQTRAGEVVFASHSPTLNAFLAAALFCEEYAAAGFAFSKAPGGEADVFTLSRPAVVAKSLSRPMED